MALHPQVIKNIRMRLKARMGSLRKEFKLKRARRIPVSPKTAWTPHDMARRAGERYQKMQLALMSIVEKHHGEVGIYRKMAVKERKFTDAFNRVTRNIRALMGEIPDVWRDLQILRMELHHLFPATAQRRLPDAVGRLFPTTDDMPAVFITWMEHRAGMAHLARMAPSGRQLGILSKASKGHLTNYLNALLDQVDGMKLAGEPEKQIGLYYVQQVREIYQQYTPTMMSKTGRNTVAWHLDDIERRLLLLP